MNGDAEYRRYRDQPPTVPSPVPAVEEAVSQLAAERDPSLEAAGRAVRSDGSSRVAWVRPTDFMTYAGPAIGRGIDLQAELIRRARSTPVSAAAATPRAVERAAHRRRMVGAPQEGLQL